MTRKTLVFGNGASACHIACELVKRDVEVILAASGPVDPAKIAEDPGREGALEILKEALPVSCRGTLGNFNVSFANADGRVTRTVSDIVIAETSIRTKNFDRYGLTEGPSVLSTSGMYRLLLEPSGIKRMGGNAPSAAFLTGLSNESNPQVLEEVLRACQVLQTVYGFRTYLFTGNLKVGGAGLEALYRRAREAGTVFFKFTDAMPEISQDASGTVTIAFTDELSREPFTLTPTLTVVDETLDPSPHLAKLAEVFELETDPDGFLQGDNVHRLTALTNRKGIFVAGAARLPLSSRDQVNDAANALMETEALAKAVAAHTADGSGKSAATGTLAKAVIDRGLCAGCLTCYRVCPYRAVVTEGRPEIAPEACQGCGTCASECPSIAIAVSGLSSAAMRERVAAMGAAAAQESAPSIVAFCCGRSALPARDLAACMGHELPAGLKVVDVPCAGGITLSHLLHAFEGGAAGVLVLTCHGGNCHSETGNLHARRRAGQLEALMAQIGIAGERLRVETLASNMGAEFSRIAASFETTLVELVPIRPGDTA